VALRGAPAPVWARDPAAAFYAAEHGVSEQEGRRRFGNEAHVSNLARSLRLRPIAGYADRWMQHEPSYALVADFKGAPPRAAVLAIAHEAIYADIVVGAARRNRAQVARDGDRLLARLRGTPGPRTGGYDVKTGRCDYRLPPPPRWPMPSAASRMTSGPMSSCESAPSPSRRHVGPASRLHPLKRGGKGRGLGV
jgi:hypothetical protein